MQRLAFALQPLQCATCDPLPSPALPAPPQSLPRPCLPAASCVPPSLQLDSLSSLPRPPAMPGPQAFTSALWPPGCPPVVRVGRVGCYPSYTMMLDMAASARDAGPLGQAQDAHYDMSVSNTFCPCKEVVTDQ